MESRLAAFEMQMKDVMSHTCPSSFSVTTTHPRTYSACVYNGIQNKQRQQHYVAQPAQTVPLLDSFNNKPTYNTDIPLPSKTQTKHPAEHSAPQHGQTQQDPTNSDMHGIQLREHVLSPVGQTLYTARINPMDYERLLGVMTVWFLM